MRQTVNIIRNPEDAVFVGRSYEMDIFSQAYIDVEQTGNSGLINYYGLGGVGKSALINRL